MNPCPRNRPPLTWLALDALNAHETDALRTHLKTCAGCRRYFAEMSLVKENISATAETEPAVEVSPAFHQNLIRKLYARQSHSSPEKITACFALIRWQLALLFTAMLVLLAVLILNGSRKVPATAVPNSTHPMAVSTLNNDPSPTAGNYDFIARQSPDKLDELLNRQGNQPLPPVPTFRASGFVPDNTSYSDLLQTDPSK